MAAYLPVRVDRNPLFILLILHNPYSLPEGELYSFWITKASLTIHSQIASPTQ